MSATEKTKKLASEKIGDLVVDVEARQKDDGTILLVATCGETRREHGVSANHLGDHEYADGQFAKDIEIAMDLVAKEAAGHERTRLMRDKFFAEKVKENEPGG